MKPGLILMTLFLSLSIAAQRKMPSFTFLHNSTEFADANRSLNDDNQYSDTLHDDRLVTGLSRILADNPELRIQLVGHCASNEDYSLGVKRAERVKALLMEKNIEYDRIEVASQGSSKPIISNEIILKLPSSIEKEAALQRNRRVEVVVIGNETEEK